MDWNAEFNLLNTMCSPSQLCLYQQKNQTNLQGQLAAPTRCVPSSISLLLLQPWTQLGWAAPSRALPCPTELLVWGSWVCQSPPDLPQTSISHRWGARSRGCPGTGLSSPCNKGVGVPRGSSFPLKHPTQGGGAGAVVPPASWALHQCPKHFCKFRRRWNKTQSWNYA